MVAKRDRQLIRIQIADRFQNGHQSVAQIVKDLNVTHQTVHAWKDAKLSDKKNFGDRPRSGRPRAIRGPKIQQFRRAVESRMSGYRTFTAKKFGISPSTVRRTIRRLGGRRLPNRHGLILIPRDRERRLKYASHWKDADVKLWTMFDDKSLEVPPSPPGTHNSPQYRFPNSSRELRVFGVRKVRTKLLMWVGCNFTGKSQPQFNVREKIIQRGPRKGQVSWKTFNVDATETVRRLKEIVFPFMEQSKSKVLVLDNAQPQANQLVLGTIKANKAVSTIGLQNLKLAAKFRDPFGYPPNSPDCSWMDCGVFSTFEQKFREENPQTIEEAMEVATRLWNEVPQEDIQSYITGYHNRLLEIEAGNGGPSSWLTSVDHP